MGTTLRIAKTYNVEWNSGGFSGSPNGFSNIICKFHSHYKDDIDYETNVEILKEDFKTVISNLQKMTDEEFTKILRSEIWDYTRLETVSGFEEYLTESDPNHDRIFFTWY